MSTDMRARLTVTADANGLVTEMRRSKDGLRDLRREGETTANAINNSAGAQRQALEGMAAAAAKAALHQDDLVAAEKRALEVRRQAAAQGRGSFATPSPAINAAVSGVFDAGEFRIAETAADGLRQTVSGLGDTVSAAVDEMMQATVEARVYGEALDEVRRVFSPLYAESKRYEEALDAIARAERISAITANEAAAARERAARALAPVVPVAGLSPDGDVYAARTRAQAEQAARAYKALAESHNPVIRAQRELAQSQAIVDRALSAGVITNTEASATLQRLEAGHRSFVQSQSPAAQSARAMERAIEEEAAAIRQLTLALDPAARATADLERTQQQLQRAVRMNIITQEEATRVMTLYEAQQQAVQRGGMSMGMGVQNASYQIADFAVQVQAGQSASLALAQQLPQLLGGFGILGAVMGAVVAVGAPLVTMLLKSGDAAGTLDERMGRLDEASSAVRESLKLLRDENLSFTFGDMTSSVREMTEAMLDLDRAAQLRSMRESLDSLLTEDTKPTILQRVSTLLGTTGTSASMDETLDSFTARNFSRMTGGRGPSYDDFTARRSLIDQLLGDGDVKRVQEEITALINDFTSDAPFEQMSAELETMLKTLRDLAQAASQMEADFNGTARAEALRAEIAERTRLAEQELSLAETRARFGADSRQAALEEQRIARENIALELERNGIAGEALDQLMAAYDRKQELTDATATWAARMADVKGEIGGILASLNALAGGVVDRAARAAELQVLNAGGTIADAAARGQQLRREAEQGARIMAASNPLERAAAMARNWWENAGVDQEAQLAAAREEARRREQEANRPGRGGTGGDRGGAGRSAASAGASITAELARLKPSYEADIAAAAAWREKALEQLNATRDGYAQFAADVETIYQERLRKAYEDDLARREDWAAGVERALIKVEDDMKTWADVAEDLVTGWAKQGEDAFVAFGRSGKLSVQDLIDFTLEQFLRLQYQQTVAPLMNGFSSWITGAIGSALGVPGAAAPVSTNHTGSPGVMRSYNLGGFGDRMRTDERLTMVRDGEEIMTSRALENAGALISNLSAIASQASQPVIIGQGQQGPMTVIVQDYSGGVQAEQGTDSRGNPTLTMTIGRQMAAAAGQPGNPFGRSIEARYGVRKQGIPR